MTEKEKEIRKIAYEEGYSQGKLVLDKVKFIIQNLKIAAVGLNKKEAAEAYKNCIEIINIHQK